MNVNERRVSLVLFVVLVALLGGLTWMLADWPERSMVAASTNHYNGPIQSDNAGDDEGTSHSSTVWYYKDTDPHFVAQAYRIYYGGRHPEMWCASNKLWRMDSRKYYEWDAEDEEWDLVESVDASGYRNTGTPGLAWHNDYDNVFMDHGAYVQQRLRYHLVACSFDIPEPTDWPGTWHNHYLE